MISPTAIEYLRQQTTPTATGLAKFAPDGFYQDEPCTCTGICRDDCDGEICGCSACWELSQDEG